jgi:hypothetical protein
LLPVFFNFKKERKKERKIVLAFLKVACPWNLYWVHFIFKGPKSNKYVQFHLVNKQSTRLSYPRREIVNKLKHITNLED